MEYIVIHCSDSPQGRGDTAGDIHRWHQIRGWDGIGYNYVLLEDGTRQSGRPVFPFEKTFWKGAHVRNYNGRSIGICLIGRDEFTPEQGEALNKVIKELHEVWPKAKVVGHYELDSHKTCPNFDVSRFLETGEFVK